MFRVFIFFLFILLFFGDVAKPLPTSPIKIKRGKRKI